MSSPVRIREAIEADTAFVLDSWRRSFEGSPAVNGAERAHLFGEMAHVIGALTARPGAIVRVACDASDPDVLLGYAVANERLRELHYVYVRQEVREQGLARQLLEGLDLKQFTFRTQALERRIKPRARGWSFTPRFTI